MTDHTTMNTVIQAALRRDLQPFDLLNLVPGRSYRRSIAPVWATT